MQQTELQVVNVNARRLENTGRKGERIEVHNVKHRYGSTHAGVVAYRWDRWDRWACWPVHGRGGT